MLLVVIQRLSSSLAVFVAFDRFDQCTPYSIRLTYFSSLMFLTQLAPIFIYEVDLFLTE